MSLKEKYISEIRAALQNTFHYKSVAGAPRFTKVVVNVGFGKLLKDAKIQEAVRSTLEHITGQKSVFTKARKSISNFKVREGQIIGAKVTLRGARMYDFIDKLINITFPRVRDFRGLSEKSFDQRGNLAIGFKEHVAFPEVRSDEVDRLHGLEVAVTTDAKTPEEAKMLFRLAGFPLQKITK
ncbi:MAG: 50S ribosomal protein L5 [Candidatus Magasanikbacteria bacterium]|nr:50S ribosomal protein L5 [Candidatus Magasanikbacteria bacterium]